MSPSRSDIRANLAAQLTTPVRWVDLVERIAGEQRHGVRRSRTATGLDQAESPHSRRASASPASSPATIRRTPGVEQFFYVQALLECLGATSEAVAAAVRRRRRRIRPWPANSPSKPRRRVRSAHVDATAAPRREDAPHGLRQATTPVAAREPAPTRRRRTAMAPVRRTRRRRTAGYAQATAPVMAQPHRSPPAAAPAAARTAPPASGCGRAAPLRCPLRLLPPHRLLLPPPAPPKPAATAPEPAELEKFLINFVVEQTGYPPEVVELDADLEADLGIDSIKKAQLFGELAEYFDVQPTENMTLDDFPTLRHVLNFLAGAQMKGDAAGGQPGCRCRGCPRRRPLPPRPAAVVARCSRLLRRAAVAPVAAAGSDPAELEKFLINFVVEQTGYPPEVVELDADLEADLGIDSIKKAQLFGELAEYFDVPPTENLTLDDFPTLRHVLNFLAERADEGRRTASRGTPAACCRSAGHRRATAWPAPWQARPLQLPRRRSQPRSPRRPASLDPAELEKFLINFVVEQTGYPPEVVELDADLEADLGIDSIKKAQLFGELAEYFDVQPTENLTLDDFPTLRHVLNFLAGAPDEGRLAPADDRRRPPWRQSQPAACSVPRRLLRSAAPSQAAAAQRRRPTRSAGSDPAELEKFLINFVVEQTGYPPEVVELDADLEADLGIDSIKKAQLFGELAEYFDVQPTENLTLDDFPTLRHVVDFLVGNDLKKNLTPSRMTVARP